MGAKLSKSCCKIFTLKEICSSGLVFVIFLGGFALDELSTIDSLGFTLPSPAYIFGALLFGLIGLAVFRYGRKTTNRGVKWIGVALLLYPYAISATWLLYLVGVGLCASLYWFRK